MDFKSVVTIIKDELRDPIPPVLATKSFTPIVHFGAKSIEFLFSNYYITLRDNGTCDCRNVYGG